jgi:hypothetical protein
LCVDPQEDVGIPPLTQNDIDKMSLCEIKEKLKELNVKTKLRSLVKLKELLKNTIGLS